MQQQTLYQLFVEKWGNCQDCELHETRRNVVLGRGKVPCDVCFIGEAPGTSEDDLGVPFCVEESHRFLTADLVWKPMGDAVVGQKIIAPDEHGERLTEVKSATGIGLRKWRVAEILAVRKSKKPCYIVETDCGYLIATEDHLVLTASPAGHKTAKWRRVDQLVCQKSRASSLTLAMQPWKSGIDYNSGWIGGLLDGEGWLAKKGSKLKCGFAQNPGPVLDQAVSIFSRMGFSLSNDSSKDVKNVKLCVKGGLRKIFELIGVTRPVRLLDKVQQSIAARPPKVYGLTPARVKKIVFVGMQNVVDIKTTTGTFLCDGFIVHNCGRAGMLLDDQIEEAWKNYSLCPLCQAALVPGIGERKCRRNHAFALDYKGQPIRKAFTNLVCCIPLDENLVKNSEPSHEQIMACQPRLVEFIEIARPRLIINVGKLAKEYLDQGYRASAKIGPIPQVSITHPAALLRWSVIQRDLEHQRTILNLRKALQYI